MRSNTSRPFSAVVTRYPARFNAIFETRRMSGSSSARSKCRLMSARILSSSRPRARRERRSVAGEANLERRAVLTAAGHVDGSPVLLHQRFRDRQAQSRALLLAGLVHLDLRELLEQARHALGRDA